VKEFGVRSLGFGVWGSEFGVPGSCSSSCSCSISGTSAPKREPDPSAIILFYHSDREICRILEHEQEHEHDFSTSAFRFRKHAFRGLATPNPEPQTPNPKLQTTTSCGANGCKARLTPAGHDAGHVRRHGLARPLGSGRRYGWWRGGGQ